MSGLPWRSGGSAWEEGIEWARKIPDSECEGNQREQRFRAQVENYLTYADTVVISTYGWVEDWYYRPYNDGHDPRVKFRLVEELPPGKNIKYGKWCNTHQIVHLLQACEVVDTKYVLRTRTDEYYHNLAPMFEIFEKDTKKIVATNSNWSIAMPWFVDDKFYLTETRIMQRAYDQIMTMLENIGMVVLPHPYYDSGMYSVEYVTAWHLKKASEHFYPPEGEEGLLDRFQVVDIEEFEDCRIALREGETDLKGIMEKYPVRMDSKRLEGIRFS